jgi:hypothetical protein
MLTYTGRRNLYGSYTTSTTANLATGDTWMNNIERQILRKHNWTFLEKKDTSLTTTASTQFKELPNNVGKVRAITVTVGTQIYTATEVTSEREWQMLNQSPSTSDTVEKFYIRAGQFGLFPTPASSSNQITIYHKPVFKDLSIADYTTGGVLTATSGSASLVGTGTTWTTSMAGRFIRITESDTTNKGDGYWYEIFSVGSATTITLVKPYIGTSIATGNAAYTIGQVGLIPEDYQEIPVLLATYKYWLGPGNNTAKATQYKNDAADLLKDMFVDYGNKTTSPVLDYGTGEVEPTNPNLYVTQ